MTDPVLVTGATGNVGGAVARSLLAAGLPVRVAGTDPSELRARFPEAEAARLDFFDARPPRTLDRYVRDHRDRWATGTPIR